VYGVLLLPNGTGSDAFVLGLRSANVLAVYEAYVLSAGAKFILYKFELLFAFALCLRFCVRC